MCNLVDVETNYGTTIQVADIKKNIILNLIESAKECKQIEQIILFGSALEERCNKESDIDIAIISNITESRLYRTKSYDNFLNYLFEVDSNQEYDRLVFSSYDKIKEQMNDIFIFKEIVTKGKLIYRRI